jgi:predicted pyridoxine 5'-phosphate oxidase superfamily flavin-nucleotide-binding protein
MRDAAVTTRDPFHEGERYVQARTGEREVALRNGGLVGEAIPARAIPFLAQQRMLAIGSADEQGAVSASVLFGARGLASSPDGRSVVIDRTRIDVSLDDPTWSNLRVGVDVGLLAIELGSRRRLRVNGVVRSLDGERVEVSVREAYPNCPKYIQRRHLREEPGARPADPPPRASGVSLDGVRSLVVERADTLFVASRHPTRGVDVSHRGGAPGFVRVLDPRRLRIPDYPGNSMFNTLGNFVVDDHAGLVFLDFDGAGLLQMTGTVAVRFDEAEDPRQPTGGSGRYWEFHVARWLELPVATHLAWEFLDYSPHNPSTLK